MSEISQKHPLSAHACRRPYMWQPLLTELFTLIYSAHSVFFLFEIELNLSITFTRQVCWSAWWTLRTMRPSSPTSMAPWETSPNGSPISMITAFRRRGNSVMCWLLDICVWAHLWTACRWYYPKFVAQLSFCRVPCQARSHVIKKNVVISVAKDALFLIKYYFPFLLAVPRRPSQSSHIWFHLALIQAIGPPWRKRWRVTPTKASRYRLGFVLSYDTPSLAFIRTSSSPLSLTHSH